MHDLTQYLSEEDRLKVANNQEKLTSDLSKTKECSSNNEQDKPQANVDL